MKKILFYILILGFVLGGSARVQADTSYTLLEPLPCIPGTGQNCTNTNTTISTITQVNIDQYINYVIKLALAIAVFLATVEIIWGGFEWMVSAVPYVKVEGKKRIADAVFGLLAVLGSWLVLRTIDPRLVLVDTKLPVICPTEMQTQGICDMSALQRLEKSYLDTLKQGANDQQLKALQIRQAVNDLDKEKNDLDSQWQQGQLDETTYKNKLAEIEMSRNKSLSDGNLAQGDYEMANTFQQALTDIQKNQGYEPERKDGFKKAIDDIYAKYQNSPGLANDPKNKQKLQLLKDFFDKQIDEENDLAKKLTYADVEKVYRVNDQTSDLFDTKKVEHMKADLGTARVNYNAQLKFLSDPTPTPDPASQTPVTNDPPPLIKNDPTLYPLIVKVKADAELAPLYKTMLATRIDAITTMLQKVEYDKAQAAGSKSGEAIGNVGAILK